MKDKLILLTGATAGIGQEVARRLAETSATLVLVARNEAKAKALTDELRATNQNVSFLLGDLSRPAEVKRVAAEFRAAHDRLDVLFNNAGALFVDRQETEDGLERTFALNHLAYFLLTTELLDVLKASAPARVVSTSSRAHRRGDLGFTDDWQSKTWSTGGVRAYGNSKLANIWFTSELAKRLAGSGVSAHCFHPGFVASQFARNNGFLANVFMTLTRPFQRTVAQGADTGVWLATSADVPANGYYVDRTLTTPSGAARDPHAPGKLWVESERLANTLS
jgi:NAD(P)-dependent dehydrogenase (short-subunit alcohol dehydrogenase family)